MELISFCGSVLIGFAIPYSSWKKVHVYVDVLVEKLSTEKQDDNECDYAMHGHRIVCLYRV